MSEQNSEFSRVRRKRKNSKANKLLNWMIAIVILLIVIVGVKIISGDNDLEKEEASVTETNPLDDGAMDEDSDPKDEGAVESDENEDQSTSEEDDSTKEGTVKDETEDDEKDSSSKKKDKTEGTVTYSASEDAVVDETVSNTSWEPIGTSQTGKHESVYDGKSMDWQEKEKALAYATGLSQNDMIFWKIKNGGSPQKSIGIVSSKDKSEKYRVYLEWVDGEGWKPTQMDVLNTLDFKY